MNRPKKKLRKFLNILSMYKSSEKALTYPIAMQVEVTCGCNISCKMCVVPNLLTRKKGFMSFETFKNIYDQIKPDTVVLTGYGESLLNKDIFRIIEYAKKNNSSVHMDTNCTLLDESRSQKLIVSGIDLVKVSIDGATKETYDKIRLESNYDVLWENLRTFVRLKKEVGMENPLLNLSCIIQPENFEELCSIVEAGYNLGKIDLRFGIVTDYGNNKEGTYNFWKDIDQKKVLDSFDVALKRSKELGLQSTFSTLSGAKEQYIELMRTKRLKMGACFWPWTSLFITSEGLIKPCCYFYDKDMVMGDLRKKKFKDIWNNYQYQLFRKNLVTNREVYPRCTVCGTDETHLFDKIDNSLKYVPFIKSEYKTLGNGNWQSKQ